MINEIARKRFAVFRKMYLFFMLVVALQYLFASRQTSSYLLQPPQWCLGNVGRWNAVIPHPKKSTQTISPGSGQKTSNMRFATCTS